jgi:ribosomal-protein-alanine N-acetyltransferase
MRKGSGRAHGGPCRIRPISKSDLDAILLIEASSFAHPWPRGLFLSELRRGEASRCFVADVPSCDPERIIPIANQIPDPEETGEVAGYIMAWLVADELHVTNLAVEPTHRRSGIAAALLDHTLKDARNRGAVWCQLEVRISNTPARSLYERFGFHEIGVRKGYYQDEEDAVVMGLELSF